LENKFEETLAEIAGQSTPDMNFMGFISWYSSSIISAVYTAIVLFSIVRKALDKIIAELQNRRVKPADTMMLINGESTDG
jgi:hypothetical protein